MNPDTFRRMQFSGTPILVTGGSGFVGSRVAARLAAEGAQVRAIVRKAGNHEGLDSPNVTQVEGDFVDGSTSRAACGGIELVVHCAAAGGADLEEVRRINKTGTAVLAKSAREAGCRRFVHISTVSVYRRATHTGIFAEDHPMKDTGDPYGVTKAEAEHEVLAAVQKGLEAVILRPSAILGAHPTSTWGTKIPRSVREGKLPFPVDSDEQFPWVHVDDLVDAVVLALTAPGIADGRAYNVSTANITWRDYVDEIRSWYPDTMNVEFTRKEPDDPTAFWDGRFPDDRLRGELGYVPTRTFADGAAESAAWWRAQK